MIVDFKSICKDVAKENDIDLNALLSINNLVFKKYQIGLKIQLLYEFI